jgi:hypothetical protein
MLIMVGAWWMHTVATMTHCELNDPIMSLAPKVSTTFVTIYCHYYLVKLWWFEAKPQNWLFLRLSTHSDCNNPILLCKGEDDCLCLRHSYCIAVNTPHKDVCCTTDKQRGEVCKLALFCCDLALVYPTKLCGCAGQFLCCYSVASLPCTREYVPDCVCSFCYLQCFPKCGCCVAPPPCPALDKVLRNQPIHSQVMVRKWFFW